MTWVDIRPEETVLECRRLDTMFWSSILGKSRGLQKVMPRRSDRVIGADLFNALYHWNPKLKEEPPDPAIAAWLDRSMSDPGFNELRMKTAGDKNLAAAGAVRLFRELMRQEESDFKTAAQIKHQIDQAETMFSGVPSGERAVEALKQAQEKLSEAIEQETETKVTMSQTEERQMYRDLVDNAGLGPQEALNRIDEKAGNQARDTIKGQGTSQLTEVSNRIIEDLENMQELSEFDGKGANLDPNDNSERVLTGILDENLVNKVTAQDQFRRVLRAAGRMRMILDSAKSKKPQPAPPPVGLMYGDELSYIVSSELVLLADPELEDLFYAKYLDKALMQYEHKDREKEGLGPFIACVDYSGSMTGAPMIHAQALFVALARLAIKQGREVGYIPFATSATEVHMISSSEDLVKVLTGNYMRKIGGGTLFPPPLNNAIDFIKSKSKSSWKKADILLITDGYSSYASGWADSFNKLRSELGVRTFGVTVHASRTGTLEPIMDAMADMSSSGNISKLDWLEHIATQLV